MEPMLSISMATGLEQLSQLIKLCLDLDILISAIIDHSYMPIVVSMKLGDTFLALPTIFNKILQLVVKINIFQINQ